jgi:hypothetical protein
MRIMVLVDDVAQRLAAASFTLAMLKPPSNLRLSSMEAHRVELHARLRASPLAHASRDGPWREVRHPSSA